MKINPTTLVYPRTKKNIRAIFNHYFENAPISELKEVSKHYYNENIYGLKDLEKIAENTASLNLFFEDMFKTKPTLKLKMKYVEDVLMKSELEWEKSSQESHKIKLKILDLIKGNSDK